MDSTAQRWRDHCINCTVACTLHTCNLWLVLQNVEWSLLQMNHAKPLTAFSGKFDKLFIALLFYLDLSRLSSEELIEQLQRQLKDEHRQLMQVRVVADRKLIDQNIAILFWDDVSIFYRSFNCCTVHFVQKYDPVVLPTVMYCMMLSVQ